MSNIMTWLSMVIAMFFIASVWFSYLIRVVLNDEVVQERKRRRARVRELERRKAEDKANRTKQRHY